MKKAPCACLVLVSGALLVGGAASAQQSIPERTSRPSGVDRGLSFGLRAGYGVPLGDAFGSTPDASGKLSDQIKGMIPLWLDVGYRLNPNLYLGGFFQFGVGFSPSNCGTLISCSQNDLRFGLNAHFHILPAEAFDPWVGIGAGYEILNESGFAPSLATSFSSSFGGFEFANLQLGVDMKLSPVFSVGPYVAFTVGQLSNGSGTLTTPLGTVSLSGIQDKKIHQWLMFGLKGQLNLSLD